MNDHNGCKPPHPSRLAHTFSIVARDPRSGEMGVAVQSHWFSVGSLVAWAEAGVGAVATQALAEIICSRRVYLDIGWQASAQSAGGIVALRIVDFRARLGYTGCVPGKHKCSALCSAWSRQPAGD